MVTRCHGDHGYCHQPLLICTNVADPDSSSAAPARASANRDPRPTWTASDESFRDSAGTFFPIHASVPRTCFYGHGG